MVVVIVIAAATVVQVGAQGGRGPQPPAPRPPRPTQPVDGPSVQIVGGTVASAGEYPWQVALVAASQPNPQLGQFCGGSLIATQWVLTAAHCVVTGGLVTPPSDLDVVLGINNLSDGPTTGGQGQRIDVAQIVVHPGYVELTYDNDIALLRLATPATLNASVGLVGWVTPAQSALFEPGDTATITGWGATSSGGDGSNALLEVSVPIVANSTCNGPASYNGDVTGNMLCAGEVAGGKDSCQGDSGGPLIVSNGGGGFVQAGIVSWGEGCALPNFPGVYTRVANYSGWISGYVNGPPTGFKVYLPLLRNGSACTPGATGEPNDNVNTAKPICSGQVVSGQVNSVSDIDDVYAIQLAAGQRLTVTMTGSGGDADLFLYKPGTTNVLTDPISAASATATSNESFSVVIFKPGTWYIDVYAYSGSATYTLTATVTTP